MLILNFVVCTTDDVKNGVEILKEKFLIFILGTYLKRVTYINFSLLINDNLKFFWPKTKFHSWMD